MSVSLNSLVNNYTYSYQGSLRPKLDKDDDGTWSKGEIENYVKEYNKVVTDDKKLDVEKIITEYDAGGDGKISGSEMTRMLDDDVLGMANLLKMQKADTTASTTTETSSSSTSSVSSVQNSEARMVAQKSLLMNYTYEYGNELRISYRMDKDNDSYWSRDEINTYAEAYKKATGIELDVDKIFKTYDKGDKGYLTSSEQAAMQKADALGLGKLASMIKTAESEKSYYTKPATYRESERTGAKNASSSGDWMDAMSSAQKMALSSIVQRSEQAGFLISSMMGGSASLSSLSSLVNQQSTMQMYSKYSYTNGLDTSV